MEERGPRDRLGFGVSPELLAHPLARGRRLSPAMALTPRSEYCRSRLPTSHLRCHWLGGWEYYLCPLVPARVQVCQASSHHPSASSATGADVYRSRPVMLCYSSTTPWRTSHDNLPGFRWLELAGSWVGLELFAGLARAKAPGIPALVSGWSLYSPVYHNQPGFR